MYPHDSISYSVEYLLGTDDWWWAVKNHHHHIIPSNKMRSNRRLRYASLYHSIGCLFCFIISGSKQTNEQTIKKTIANNELTITEGVDDGTHSERVFDER